MLIFLPFGVGHVYKSILKIFYRFFLNLYYILNSMTNNMTNNVDQIIKLAWHDKTSFEEIKRKYNISEEGVIKIMRTNLKISSFKLWRKRVSGRRSKHRKKSLILSKFENYKIYANKFN